MYIFSQNTDYSSMNQPLKNVGERKRRGKVLNDENLGIIDQV